MKPPQVSESEAPVVQAARAEGVRLGLQEAAFICEGYQAEMSEGYDHQTEAAAAGVCFKRIDERLSQKTE